MKVVLIEPSASFANEPNMNPPLGLAYISAYLKANGVKDIMAVDFTVPGTTVESIPLDADVYGISGMTPQWKSVVEIIKYIRVHNWNCKIMIGGHHITNCPEDLPIEATGAVRGDGEEAMFMAVTTCYYGSISEINRVDVSKLPWPDRDVFGLDNYVRTIKGEKAVHIITSRGCPFSCSFCCRVSVGRKVRYRIVEDIIEEIDFIKAKYGTRAFVIYDDIFTLNKDRVSRLCQEFRKRDIIWRCWSRADTLTYDLLREMRDSGLSSITMGVESGSDIVLESIEKGLTRERNKQALLWCKQLEVPVRCSLMYGNPGESKETVQDTIDLITECQPDEWNLAILTPIPGSAIWNEPERFGIKFDKQWVRSRLYDVTNRFGNSGVGDNWYQFTNMTPEEFSKNLKYFTTTLESKCPRKNIQDSIQIIDIDKVNRYSGICS